MRKPPLKEVMRRKIILAFFIIMAKGFGKTMPKQGDGLRKPQRKEMSSRDITSALSTIMATEDSVAPVEYGAQGV
jgi:hypothetical protein